MTNDHRWTETGSDARLREVADMGAINRGYRLERFRHMLEEWRVRQTAPASDEPGQGHPDPDETPPGDPPDYDPLPPEEG